MSMHPVHSIRDYWSRDWILGVPSLAQIMTVARFKTVTLYLRLNDNSKMPARGTPGFDKLFKVRSFLEAIHANFLSQYVPHKQVDIDEAMIKFKGRGSLKHGKWHEVYSDNFFTSLELLQTLFCNKTFHVEL